MKKRIICAILTISLIFCELVPAYAAYEAGENKLPEGCVALTDEEVANLSYAIAPDEEPGEIIANAKNTRAVTRASTGSRVLSISVCALLRNIDTDEKFYNSSLGRTVRFNSSTQSEGIHISHASTVALMDRVDAYIAAQPENLEFIGWYFSCVFLFESSRPRYALYHPTQTYIGSTAEKRVNISSTRYQLPLSGGFLFPAGRDPRTAYYYLGFDGTYYYQATNGQLIGSLFGADAAFNHSSGT